MTRVGVLTAATAVGCGLAGGVFFAFSAFVLRAIGALAPADSVRAMQSVNRVAVSPPLMALLFGTALAAVALVVVTPKGDGANRALVLAGCGIYLVGVIGVTAAGNVPLNDKLALVDPAAADVAARWAAFADPWAVLNDVRTAAGLLAAAALTVGLSA